MHCDSTIELTLFQRPLYVVIAAFARALPRAKPKVRVGDAPNKEDLRVESKEKPSLEPAKTHFRSYEVSLPVPTATMSAPPILPCGEAAVQDAENSMWYAQLASQLAWVATPVRMLSDYLPSGSEQDTDAGSCEPETTAASTSSSHLDSEHGSLDSSSTKVESIPVVASSGNLLDNSNTTHRRVAGTVAMTRPPSECPPRSIGPTRTLINRLPTYLRDADGRPLNSLPGIIFTQRYVNPLSTAFGLNINLRREHGGRTSEATSLSSDTSKASLTRDNSGDRTSTSSLGSPWIDPFTTDTPRAEARLSRGKFGSIRKLGTRLRKSVSLRRPRSMSLDVGAQRDTNLQTSPLSQQVLTGERPEASRANSGSLSASMSLPYVVGVDQSALGWDCRLP